MRQIPSNEGKSPRTSYTHHEHRIVATRLIIIAALFIIQFFFIHWQQFAKLLNQIIYWYF